MAIWSDFMTDSKRKWPARLGSVGVGIINGLLGAGGGMLAVPLLKSTGAEQKEAHATSIALICPLCIFSAVLYLVLGRVTLNQSLVYMPSGAIGAVIGALLLSKISDKWLKRLFALFMIWAGIRMWMK